MSKHDEMSIELEDAVARAVRRPVRTAAVPPFDAVARRATRPRPQRAAAAMVLAILVLAVIAGGALTQRRTPVAATTQPSAPATLGVATRPSDPPMATPSAAEASAWQRVRQALSPTEPIARPQWLPTRVDRSAVEARELSAHSYIIVYGTSGGPQIAFALGSSQPPIAPDDAAASVGPVRRVSASLRVPHAALANPGQAVVRRVEWSEQSRWLRIESAQLTGAELVQIAWDLDLTGAPAPAHAFTREGPSTCASADPAVTVRAFLGLAGSGQDRAVLDCYALPLLESVGPGIGQNWADLPRATLVSLDARPDVAGRPQLMVTWTFARDPGGAWTSPATRFVLLAREGSVYRIVDVASAPIGSYP